MKPLDPSLSRAALAAVAALGLAMVGADCNGNIVSDPTFRDWCDNQLCAWHTDFGRVEPVPTWNANDLGVSFLDNGATGTQITQVTQESQATCILFTSVGNLAPSAAMVVSVDFDSDGIIDYHQQLGAASWQPVQTEITAPRGYSGITFHVTKTGQGTAVLAEMRITSSSGCKAPPPQLTNLKLGDGCSTTEQCAAGLVCPTATALTGAQCGQCDDQTPCAGGAGCQQRSVFLPAQCGPGQGLGAAGAPCLAGSDCASGTCDGATPVPLRAPDAGGSCDLSTLGDGDPNNCAWFSAVGGVCR